MTVPDMDKQGLLNDKQIHLLCSPSSPNQLPMLHPYEPESKKMGHLSGGLSYMGYDIHLAEEVRQLLPMRVYPGEDVPKRRPSDIHYVVHPLTDPNPHALGSYVLYPGEFVIAGTKEYFHMPQDVCGLVKDKSTLARLGLAVQNTVLEPGWEGYLTIEISNHGPLEVILTKNMPIAQVMFFRGEQPSKSYSGKYQKQEHGQGAL